MQAFVYFFFFFFLFAGMVDVLDAVRIFGIEISEQLFLRLAIGGGTLICLICLILKQVAPKNYWKYFLSSIYLLFGVLAFVFSGAVLWEDPLMNLFISVVILYDIKRNTS